MPYGLLLKKQGILSGQAGRFGQRPLFPLQPVINPRAPGARTQLAFPTLNLMPQFGPAGVGDPGIFGAIGKFVGGVAKSVVRNVPIVGTAVKAIEAGINATRVGAPVSRSLPTGTAINMGGPMTIATPPSFASVVPPVPPPSGEIASGSTVVSTPDGSTAIVPTNATVCHVAGYHLNKAGYWKNGSNLIPGAHYVAKGSVCVKNRRMNPFNPRAASRAMHRLHSLAMGMKGMKKSIGKLSRAAGVHSAAPRHKGKR